MHMIILNECLFICKWTAHTLASELDNPIIKPKHPHFLLNSLEFEYRFLRFKIGQVGPTQHILVNVL